MCLAACGFLLPPETGFAPSDAARRAADPILLQQPQIEAATAPLAAPTAPPLEGRVAALRGRAARLQTPVLDPQTQRRLQDAAQATGL